MKEKAYRMITLSLTEEDSQILEKLSLLSGWNEHHILVATIRNYLTGWIKVYEKQYRDNWHMDPYTGAPITNSALVVGKLAEKEKK